MDTDRDRPMPLPAELYDGTLSAYFDRLRQIFADMDHKYNAAAAHYGFKCNGCEDNCCLTHFYHHTYLEFLFIREGFGKLRRQRQDELKVKAEAFCCQAAQANKNATTVRLMCPLNDAERCLLYSYRPMICRLHGIPHELQKPGHATIYGPGCGAFDRQCSGRPYYKFDRTPFYFEMARLENELKQAVGLTDRIKLTIAEMIIRIERSAKGIAPRA